MILRFSYVKIEEGVGEHGPMICKHGLVDRKRMFHGGSKTDVPWRIENGCSIDGSKTEIKKTGDCCTLGGGQNLVPRVVKQLRIQRRMG